MQDKIRIQLMDNFMIYVNEQQADQLISKSRKGMALMQYLILNRSAATPNYRLLSTLWSGEKSSNPENALKTLISRMRAMLNEISPDLGKCIVADRGAYHWQSHPNIQIDVYQIEDIFEELAKKKNDPKARKKLTNQLMELYTGDLLQNSRNSDWALPKATTLHNKYVDEVYAYIDLLKQEENYEEIADVCRLALDVDSFDDRLHMELMTALVKMNRNNEAMIQYKHVMHLRYRYLGTEPSEDMQEFYRQLANAGKTLESNLETIRNELCESSEQRGAFVCDYPVFQEIFNLQMRNLERLGSTIFLAIVMVSDLNGMPLESMKQDASMRGLLDILRTNLRKGDTVTQYSPTIFALLLPTVNYSTGNMVMERVKRLFYRKFPNSNIAFHYRVGPLSRDMKSVVNDEEEMD